MEWNRASALFVDVNAGLNTCATPRDVWPRAQDACSLGLQSARRNRGAARCHCLAGSLMVKPATLVDLTWTGDLAFSAETPDGRVLVTDGRSHTGLSPVELLAVATAGCMAVDVVHILARSRYPPTGMRAQFSGERAQTEPHRFIAIRLSFDIDGEVPQAVADRAVQLSR